MSHSKWGSLSCLLYRRTELLCLSWATCFLLFSFLTVHAIIISRRPFHVLPTLLAHLDPQYISLLSIKDRDDAEKREWKDIMNVTLRKSERLSPFEAADAQDLQRISEAGKRQEWLKMHWESIDFLQNDLISERFPHRMKLFLINCSLRFFTIWIAPISGFGPREHLSLESIFRAHPSACLIIISRSLDLQGQCILQPFWDRGMKVMAITPDFPFLFRDTPLQIWFKQLKNGRIDPGQVSFSQNFSNLLRLAVLYKYGGIYLDMDVIVLRDMSNLSNVIGAQSADPVTGRWTRLNNAVLIFDHHHPLLLSFIQEFTRNFNGSRWGHNGPYMVTRVVRQLQSIPDYHYTVLPCRAFYPVDWIHIATLFRSPKTGIERRWQSAKLMQFEESYTLHLWNRKSRDMDIKIGSIVEIMLQCRCIFCKYEACKTGDL